MSQMATDVDAVLTTLGRRRGARRRREHGRDDSATLRARLRPDDLVIASVYLSRRSRGGADTAGDTTADVRRPGCPRRTRSRRQTQPALSDTFRKPTRTSSSRIIDCASTATPATRHWTGKARRFRRSTRRTASVKSQSRPSSSTGPPTRWSRTSTGALARGLPNADFIPTTASRTCSTSRSTSASTHSRSLSTCRYRPRCPQKWVGAWSERRAALTPDREGFVDATTGDRFTYAELDGERTGPLACFGGTASATW